jgi:hypothetical protein
VSKNARGLILPRNGLSALNRLACWQSFTQMAQAGYPASLGRKLEYDMTSAAPRQAFDSYLCSQEVSFAKVGSFRRVEHRDFCAWASPLY